MPYGGGAKCGCCGKTVYMAEEVVAEGLKWHKMCFKCTECSKMLDTSTVKTHESKLYCKSCHTRSFGLKGYGYGGGSAGVLSTSSQGGPEHSYGKPASGGARYTGPDGCPRCGTRVYAAEKIVGAGSSWHKACFNCADCHKKLDSTTVSDNEGEIYCKGCYGKHFGPKGFGFGQGAGALTMTAGHSGTSAGVPGPKHSYGKRASGGAHYTGPDGCPRCGTRVYAAEKIVGAGSSWHKACFNCADCHKKLDSTTVSDNEGDIYCKGCYGKNFGPKGVGFGQGAGALTRT